MNYLTFYKFRDNPFRLTPDREFFFPAANHTALGEVIHFGLDQADGFIVVTGEVGTGKTLLLRCLISNLPKRFETVLLLSPHLSPKTLLLAILRDIGLEKKAAQCPSLDHLLHLLYSYLFALSKANRQLVVIIDEAQNLPPASIEQLRLLSNFESDKQKLLQIVLVGQPELKRIIEQPSLRQLLQRITINETLHALSKKEMIQYVHFRLNKAGRGDLQLNRPACNLLWRYTKGIPRMINKLMGRALLVGFARQKQVMDRKIVQEAAESLNLAQESGPVQALLKPGWILAASVALAALCFFIISRLF